MNLLTHFNETLADPYIILTLKNDEWDALLEKLPTKYKDCFISENHLVERMRICWTTRSQELSEKIPTEWSIKSWDFWEILAYHIFEEIYSWIGLHWPKKWRWKETNNKPAPYADVIFFTPINWTPAESDLLISIESKMKATNNPHSPIQDAIEWAGKDYVSRLAKSLPWLKEKYKHDALSDTTNELVYRSLINTLNRYIESETHWKYTKHAKAIAFVDNAFLEWEKGKSITLPDPAIEWLEIYVVWIDNLKDLYENTYSKIIALC
jgi:hypothetical protein